MPAWPLLLLAGVAAVGIGVAATGAHKAISLEALVQNYDGLRAFVNEHFLAAILCFGMLYVIAVALSLPVATVLTIAGGLLFGWLVATPVTAVSATIGASLIFLLAKTAVGARLAARAGPWLERISGGFKDNAASYMLFLRLVPAFPFFVVNIAPALLGVPLSTFVVTTLIGILPGTLAYSIAGAGLAGIVMAQNRSYHECIERLHQPVTSAGPASCSTAVDLGGLVNRELILAFVLLGCIALIPVAYKAWSRRNAA